MTPFPFLEAALMGGGAIQDTKLFTGNGIFYPDDNYDGVHEIHVAVPIQDKKFIFDNGIFYPDVGYDGVYEIHVNVPQKYTFPPSPLENIQKAVGDDPLTDEDMQIEIRTEYSEDAYDYHIRVNLYDVSVDPPELKGQIGGGNYGKSIKNVKVDSVAVTDPTTGAVTIVISYYAWDPSIQDYRRYETVQSGTNSYLIGYGSEGHSMSVKNK